MSIRFLATISLAVVLGAPPARAQAKQPQQIVFSPSVLKAMIAQKSKSKIPLSARMGVRRTLSSNIIVARPTAVAPTSVSQIKKTPTHR